MLQQNDVPISRLSSFQNDGVIAELHVLETVDEVSDLCRSGLPFFILGKGSNTVIDPNVSGRRLCRLSPTMVSPEVDDSTVRLPAAYTVNQVMAFCQEHGLSGLEFAAGVPASIGGMVAMNFGCWGHSVSDVLTRAWIVDETGTVRWVDNNELQFSYRRSILHASSWVVLAAEFELEVSDSDAVRAEVKARIRERLDKQPLKDRTFGSIFKNPDGQFAAALIESAGLKGYRLGNVGISEQHANFMVNYGHGTFSEVTALIEHVQRTVADATGCQLEMEVRLLS